MHKKLLPFIEDLEKAVEDEDTVAAKVALHRLNDETIYSGNEAYDRLHAIESKRWRLIGLPLGKPALMSVCSGSLQISPLPMLHV